MTYNILEIANCHGGDIQYLLELIKEYEDLKGNFGIKLQVFRWDEIGHTDYPKFEEFRGFYFTEDEWDRILTEAGKTKDIWLDVFDVYSLQILRKNLHRVKGIKLQASSLYNRYLISEFEKTDLTNTILMLNIAGYSIDEIRIALDEFSSRLKPKESILQVGFQAYPTTLLDSGLHKIELIKDAFNCKVAFTEHLSGNEPDSLILPVIATLKGADIIEKHIMHSVRETKFDYYSSVVRKQYDAYLENLNNYQAFADQPFVNAREKKYLDDSRQIPLMKYAKGAYNLLSIDEDLIYKRSGQRGMTVNDIRDRVANMYVLRKNKDAYETLQPEDFKKANIAAIIACRMKSTRLPKKAILKAGELSSIELCIKNTLALGNIQQTILATSTEEEDAVLKDHCYSDDVIFHQGDPIDVIQRFLDAVEKYKIDIVVRITGDMQYVDDEIFQFMLQSHFATGADYTGVTNAAVGTDLEIINSEALREVKRHFPSAQYSEYMTWYFQNNKDHFKVNMVDLPAELSRNYRLTLDFQEDLDLFNHIEKHFAETGETFTARKLFAYLDANPEIANINANCTLAYRTNQELIDTLNTYTRINK
jgi:N,N'-diacetyllegionaminate synthase